MLQLRSRQFYLLLSASNIATKWLDSTFFCGKRNASTEAGGKGGEVEDELPL